MSQHRNEMNSGHDRILYVATKVPTQCKEVLSRHNKLSRDKTSKLNTEETCRDMKNGSR